MMLAKRLDNLIIKALRVRVILGLVRFIHTIIIDRLSIDDNLVIMGAMNGRWYGDNAMHLYEFALKKSDRRVVWVTRNPKIFYQLRKKQKPVVLLFSLRGYLTTMKARHGFFTDSLFDLFIHPGIHNPRISLIALRHGRSVKRVRFARLGHKISENEKIQRQIESSLIRYAISTSEFISDIQEQCLLLGREKHVVTGYPRNDRLLDPTTNMRYRWHEFVGDVEYKKIVLYGPSWRHGRKPTQFFPFDDMQVSILCEFLLRHKILFLIRPHVTEMFSPSMRSMNEMQKKIPDYFRIISHDVYNDVNEFLPFVDILISDYSALYHDFLLLNRPMLFVPYDYSDFRRKNGFLYDYFEELPGLAVNSMTDMLTEIFNVLQGNDEYEDKRLRLKGKIHNYIDKSNCKRVLDLLDNE
jgi:CDP-glycerol glycerophosphotransferase (TagB/SpsB family)